MNTTTPHDRYRYECRTCGLSTVVVIPLRARLLREYECSRCGKRTPHEVTFIPGTDRLERAGAANG